MRALVIDEKAKTDIARVIAYAKGHRYSRALLNEIMLGKSSPAGDFAEYVVNIFQGYRVAYSIEEQPCGWCHHLSVSVDGIKYPNPVAVQEIVRAFGMGEMAEAISIWQEEQVKAINVLVRTK